MAVIIIIIIIIISATRGMMEVMRCPEGPAKGSDQCHVLAGICFIVQLFVFSFRSFVSIYIYIYMYIYIYIYMYI